MAYYGMFIGMVSNMARQLRKLVELRNLLMVNVVVLLVNMFCLVMQFQQGIWPVESYFQSAISAEDKQLMLETLRVFTSALDAANITYMAYGGTLIGTYRHMGPIPWDDDVDLLLNASQKAQMKAAVAGLAPQYELYVSDDLLGAAPWKFYSSALEGFIHRPFKWPYMDIFFFQENTTHIWDEASPSGPYCFPKSQIFPLNRRPFEDIWLNSPCDIRQVLSKNYKVELCRSRQFSHSMEMPMLTFNIRDVPCSRLANNFPFVYRSAVAGGYNETLKIANWTLRSHVALATCGRS